ncbi:hypothetical protein [Huginn virus]|nr:hypothetical protein [Huginn virus]
MVWRKVWGDFAVKGNITASAITGTSATLSGGLSVGGNITIADNKTVDGVDVSTLSTALRRIYYGAPGSAVSSFTITGLNLNGNQFYLVLIRVANLASSNADYYLYINGDTTNSHYARQNVYGNGTSVTAAQANDAFIGTVSANSMGTFTLLIQASGSGRPMVWGGCARDADTTTPKVYCFNYCSYSVLNMSSLTFAGTVANSIGANSLFQIYGW